MKLENIIRNTAIIGLTTKLILGVPDFSTFNNHSLQTAVAYAESQSIEQVTDETYEEKVCKSEKPTAVFFTADNDDPSFEYARSVFEQIIESYPKDIIFFEYNLGEMTPDEANSKETRKELFEKYGVWTVPSIAYGRKGKIIGVFSALPVKEQTKQEHEDALVKIAFDPQLLGFYDLRSLEQYKKRMRKENRDLLDFE